MVTIRWRVIQTPITQYNSMSSWANVIRVKLWAYAETPSPHVLRRPGSGDVAGLYFLTYTLVITIRGAWACAWACVSREATASGGERVASEISRPDGLPDGHQPNPYPTRRPPSLFDPGPAPGVVKD
jgi:hypothetical protein